MFKRRTSFKNEEADPLTREIPQGFPPPTTKRSSIRAESMRSSRKKEKKVAFLVLCVIVVIGVYVWLEDYELPRLRIEIEEEEIEPFIQQYEKVVSDNTLLNSELRTLKEKTEELTAAKKAIVLKLREMETANIAQVQLDNQNLRIQKDIMKKGIQQLSRRSVIENFGPGPHYVEIQIEFPPNNNTTKLNDDHNNTTEKRIVIEMAPLEQMPHTVHWFLEKVNRKLYDGCSFHRNAAHVLQAGPHRNFMTPPDKKLRETFRNEGFDHVLFQEYTSKFPHVQYTLGLSGRPGGPDFYISIRDNTKIHGPAGTEDDPIEAEPCFAKIVEGINVVERMHQSPVKEGKFEGLKENIAITSMRILPNYGKNL